MGRHPAKRAAFANVQLDIILLDSAEGTSRYAHAAIGRVSYSGARTARATNEYTPSAPTTIRARSSTGRPLLAVSPNPCDGVVVEDEVVDVKPSRTPRRIRRRRLQADGPGWCAAGRSRRFRRWRRGWRRPARKARHRIASAGRSAAARWPPASPAGPSDSVFQLRGPQDVGRDGVARKRRPIDQQHLNPCRPRSMAVGEPAHRAPMTIASTS